MKKRKKTDKKPQSKSKKKHSQKLYSDFNLIKISLLILIIFFSTIIARTFNPSKIRIAEINLAQEMIPCNTSEISLNISPNPVKPGESFNFKISGDASTWISDNYGGGAINCTGTWNNKICKATSTPGTYTWTHKWKKCIGNFENCSSECSISKNFSVVSASPSSAVGEISVVNSLNNAGFRQENKFTVTIENKSNKQITVDVVDELLGDVNCNGIEDRAELDKIGLASNGGEITRMGDKKWENITLAAGEKKNLQWSKTSWVPGYCVVHDLYFWTKPLNSSNPDWKGMSSGWQDAEKGNLQMKRNQAKFSVYDGMGKTENTAFGVVAKIKFNDSAVYSLSNFKKDVDQFSKDSNKLKLIRLAVMDRLATGGNQKEVFWNESNLQKLDTAIDYARSKGFQIILTHSHWDHGVEPWCDTGEKTSAGAKIYDQRCYQNGTYKNYNEELFNQYLVRYFTFLVNRYKGKIYAWNPYNETHLGCFSWWRDSQCQDSNGVLVLEPVPNLLTSDKYLSNLKSALTTIGQTIKAIDPQTKITVHHGVELVSRHTNSSDVFPWHYFSTPALDKLAETVDFISLSIYPSNNQKAIQRMVHPVDFYTYRYKKPIVVLETGNVTKTSTCQWDQAFEEISGNPTGSRGDYLKTYLDNLNGHAKAVVLYQMTDENSNSGCSDQYGLRKSDLTLRPSYSAWINYINANGSLLY